MTAPPDLTRRPAGEPDADPAAAFARPASSTGRCCYPNSCSGTESSDDTQPGG